MTELRVNLVFLVCLLGAAAGLTGTGPVAALDPDAETTRRLEELEDRFAHAPDDPDVALALAEAYLEREQPSLAITALRGADPHLLEAPSVAHRLAQAYEASGRLREALATADRALAACARALDAGAGEVLPPAPRFPCTPQEHAMLEVHRGALARMIDWRVTDPVRDERAARAYDVAMRRARVVLPE